MSKRSVNNATKVLPVSLVLANHVVDDGEFAGTVFDQAKAKKQAASQDRMAQHIENSPAAQRSFLRVQAAKQWENDHPDEDVDFATYFKSYEYTKKKKISLHSSNNTYNFSHTQSNENGETKTSVQDIEQDEFYSNTFTRPSSIPKELFRRSIDAMKRGLEENLYAHWDASSGTTRPPCIHCISKGWDLTLCGDCYSNVIGGEQLKIEQDFKAKIQTSDAADPNHKNLIHMCGVPLDWLLAFTFDHDCWHKPTWWVNRHIIQESTREQRCRYMQLDEMKSYATESSVFMSHCWGAKFGDLVLAACHGARKDRIVWIDIFAVRQWPGNGADLDFRVTLGKCHAMVVAVAPVEGLKGKLGTDDERAFFLASQEGKIAKKNLFSFRLWCVVEVAAAVSLQLNVVVKGGEAVQIKQEGTENLNATYMYNTDCIGFMMDNLRCMIDLASSECENQVDYDREMKKVQEMEGGVKGVNMAVVGVVVGATQSIRCQVVEIDAWMCGEPEALQRLILRNGSTGEELILAKKILQVACSGGRVEIVKELLLRWKIDDSYVVEKNSSVPEMYRFLGGGHNTEEEYFSKEEEKKWLVDIIGYSGVIWDATSGGHTEIVSLLLDSIQGMEAPHPVDQTTGASAFYQACALGYSNIVQLFIQKMLEEASESENADGLIAMVNQPAKTNFATPVYIACQNGHVAVVELLLKLHPYIDINQCTQPGQQTPLNIAATQGHKEVVAILWENRKLYKIDRHKKDCWGNSPADNAKIGNHEWIVQLLTVSALGYRGYDEEVEDVVDNMLEALDEQHDQTRATMDVIEKNSTDTSSLDDNTIDVLSYIVSSDEEDDDEEDDDEGAEMLARLLCL